MKQREESAKHAGTEPLHPHDDGDAFDDTTRTEAPFAEGTNISSTARRLRPFKVTVFYREPDFEARIAPRAEPFRWTYQIKASSPTAAASAAAAEFAETARLSSVSWRRDIIAIDTAETDELHTPNGTLEIDESSAH
jgi:hypothetical protein